MRFAGSVLFIVAVFQAFTSSAANLDDTASIRTMAITFDDLPYAVGDAAQDTISNAQRVTESILAVLDDYHAPATAFVNEAKLHVAGEFDERRALLQQWVDSGAILGNHTFSHVDLNNVTIAEFKQEIVKGEAATRLLMKRHEPYQFYFRHPYTHTGDSEATKMEIDSFLLDRGYKVAPYTIDSQDYIFNVVYLHSKEQGDNASAIRICGAYSSFVVGATEFAESISVQIIGRNIPQTLVLHANDINADCLDELLAQLNRRGYEFVSLDAAFSHQAYQTQDTFVTAYGPSWLWRWMKSKDMNISFRGDPELPNWITALYQGLSQPAQEGL